ncbi:MAG TPA: hypothetical protein VNX67_02550 [Solirubrobacteraceae bacterium]|nr:hypothetical protein [Solirubrobacteraceae bacterium]
MAAIALTAITLAVSGCGSSPKPLTRAELTAKANAICKTVTAKIASKTIKTQQEIARVASELASFEQTALASLSKLVPPAELEGDWKRFVSGAQTLAENTEKLGEYAKANNLKGAKGLITSSEATQKQMVAIAKRDGLTACEQVA